MKTNDSGDEQTFATSFNFAQEYLFSRLQLGILYFFINGRKFRKACNVTHVFVNDIIARGPHKVANMDEAKRGRYLFLSAVA